MLSHDYLFPNRREFLHAAAGAAAGLAFAGSATARDSGPVKIGSGKFTYTLDETWGTLPDGMSYGFGCALVVDAKDRIFVTSRSTSPCVAIFDRAGKLLETWSNDFTEKVGFSTQQYKDTAHGLYLSKEGNEEFLYWTENIDNARTRKYGARVYKTD